MSTCQDIFHSLFGKQGKETDISIPCWGLLGDLYLDIRPVIQPLFLNG